MNKLKILRVLLAVFVSTLDVFEKAIWVDLSADRDTLEEVAADKAANLTEATKALIWEAIGCAAPDIKGAYVEVMVENLAFDGYYKAAVLAPNVAFDGWTPELSDMVNENSGLIKKDLTAMLTDMVMAHLDGDSGRSDPHYEIHRRD